MPSRRDDRCGARFRRATPEPEPDADLVQEADELALTSLGQQFIEALRQDPRFRDVIDDPFGDDGPG